jgi:hypothetical protein
LVCEILAIFVSSVFNFEELYRNKYLFIGEYEEKQNYEIKQNTHNTPQKRLMINTTHVLECVCYPFQLTRILETQDGRHCLTKLRIDGMA